MGTVRITKDDNDEADNFEILVRVPVRLQHTMLASYENVE